MTPAVERLVEAAKILRRLGHCSHDNPRVKPEDCGWPTCRLVSEAIAAVEAEAKEPAKP